MAVVFLLAALVSRIPDPRGEELLFSIMLEDSSTISFTAAPGGTIPVFRREKDFKLLIEYDPSTTAGEDEPFFGNHYLRPGGSSNEGMETVSVGFTLNGDTFEVFEWYYAPEDLFSSGYTVTGQDGSLMALEGIYTTKQGSLLEVFNICIREE